MHDFLLNKRIQLNIDSTWLESYLHERTHSIKIDEIMSTSKINTWSTALINIWSNPLTFLSMTSVKLINLPEITTIVQPFMQTMFNSCSVAHLIISSMYICRDKRKNNEKMVE